MSTESDVKIFANNGSNFSGLYAAQAWCRDNGYVYGSTQRNAPIGVHRESEADYIAKWRNLSRRERAELDGHLEPVRSYRDGAVMLYLGDFRWTP